MITMLILLGNSKSLLGWALGVGFAGATNVGSSQSAFDADVAEGDGGVGTLTLGKK